MAEIDKWRRSAAVAGSFYPSAPASLTTALRQFQRLVDQAGPSGTPARRAVRGAVCPHAGYLYAGALAYATLARCELPDTLVILGVNHRHPNPPAWSIWPEGVWETPLGEVAVDNILAAALMQACPELTPSKSAHQQDHAIEVLLPMLQFQHPNSPLKIVPITPFVPRAAESAVIDVGRRLGAALAAWPTATLVIASNDMTHFAPAAVAAAQDRKALDRMTALDPPGLLTVARREKITMCGAQPVAAMLAAAAVRGATHGQLVGYTHSGVVSGNLDDVVAYAGMVIE